jgi:hypothetical protein
MPDDAPVIRITRRATGRAYDGRPATLPSLAGGCAVRLAHRVARVRLACRIGATRREESERDVAGAVPSSRGGGRMGHLPAGRMRT